MAWTTGFKEPDHPDVANRIRQVNSAPSFSNFDDIETLTIPARAPTVAPVFVFADATCRHCALLHEYRDELLQQGIEIQ